ncbi:MAG TPA: alpha/beta fold hydrolase [Candidatus Binatia bacterium]|jgi:pimeloyl-ACP methyl ester carboxylesterase|nr:alpha/beta fold hydrolase [Candidatus Binatia bacterium]
MSNATQRADGVAAAFTEHFVQADGLRIRYLEAGQGNPVVVLHGSDGLTPSPLNNLLAQQFRVIAIEIPGFGPSVVNERSQSLRDLAHTLAEAVTAIGLDRYGLVSTSASAPLALWQAIEAQERIDALVLISPVALFPEGWTAIGGRNRDPELERRLADMQTATLVLIGTRDETIPPETGRLYVERIPNCYYVLVYDAGHVIEAERPEALCAAVRDFLERRETFVVSRKTTVINP